jgi:hypothetical protein
MLWKKSRAKSGKSNTDTVLTDEIPEYIAQPLCTWIRRSEMMLCIDPDMAFLVPENFDAHKKEEMILEFQETVKKTVPFSPLRGIEDTCNYLLNHKEDWDPLLVEYVAFLLEKIIRILSVSEWGEYRVNEDPHQPQSLQPSSSVTYLQQLDICVQDLEGILDRGSSKWRVSINPDRPGLIERMDPNQQKMVKTSLSHSDLASKQLAKAYSEIFGREKDYDNGYADLIKAVEALANPLIGPRSTRQTLSRDANDMFDQNWHYVIEPTEPKYQVQGGMLRPLMHALMNNHSSRHGDEGRYEPINEKRAKAAFYVAVLLIEAFRDGYVTKDKIRSSNVE